jgi:hypothetical protein
MRVPEGGIDMGPQKWICGACWMLKINGKKK